MHIPAWDHGVHERVSIIIHSPIDNGKHLVEIVHVQQMARPFSGKDSAEKSVPVSKRLGLWTREVQHSEITARHISK